MRNPKIVIGTEAAVCLTPSAIICHRAHFVTPPVDPAKLILHVQRGGSTRYAGPDRVVKGIRLD